MGNSLRKLFQNENHHESPARVPGIGCLFEDPRSPTDGIHRTPIVLDKKKPYLETDVDALTPPRHPRLNLLQKEIDPRSPSSHIDRTPISVLDNCDNSTGFESPISLYSRYDVDLSETGLASPIEPSMNVSEFEEAHAEIVGPVLEEAGLSDTLLSDDSFSLDVNNKLNTNGEIVLQNSVDRSEQMEKPRKRLISEDLMNEIIESFKECQDLAEERALNNIAKPKSSKTSKPLSLSTRVPLSNITSAGNTPTKLSVRKSDVKVNRIGENTLTNSKLKLRKEEKNIKVAPMGENSPLNTLNKNYRAQWDHESTIII